MLKLPDPEESRAVLIGVSDYRSLTELKSVTKGLESLRELLIDPTIWGLPPENCVIVANPQNSKKLLEPLHDAARSATAALVVYFAGHGLIERGRDLRLALPDANRERLLDTVSYEDVRREVTVTGRRCPAKVVILDCCFAGMAMSEFLTGEVDIADQATVEGAYLMTATAGTALAQAPDGEMYTAFTGALVNTLRNGVADGPRLLDTATIFGQVEHRLQADNRPIPQCASRGQGSRIVIARNRNAGSSISTLWRELVADHKVWTHVPASEQSEMVRRGCVDLVEHLARLRAAADPAMESDPWTDRGLAARMSERAQWLVGLIPADHGTTAADAHRFSAGDAALIATLPFLYDTYWALLGAEAATIAPQEWMPTYEGDNKAADFWRFASGYGRLVRRVEAARDRAGAARDIGWWLLHRWIYRRTVANPADLLATLLEPTGDDRWLAKVFRRGLVGELLHGLRGDIGFALRTDRPDALLPVRMVDGGSTREQPIHEQRVAYLLAVAHAMAIDPARLPQVVVEHLATGDPVKLPSLKSAVAGAEWSGQAGVRTLEAACDHPAIDLALREHVIALDRLLTEIHLAANAHAALEPLKKLPHRASADLVRPAIVNGKPQYDDAGARFELAEDRVQELLMGEKLYGDPALAIREMYQNALDACRFRLAREEYLARRTGRPQTWTGMIQFTQGVDKSGRAYLDCTDNGVGMSKRDLTRVFSKAGVRFADLPDFLEEQAEWARQQPPIRLYPNSRFGIGVLSYFMLADEIEVRTCRFGRDGRPGDQLTVRIAGPGTLFRVINEGPGRDPGTRIRLYLRPDTQHPYSVDLLRRLLWVAQFDTTARHGVDEHHWPAGALSDAAPVGCDDPFTDTPQDDLVIWASADSPVWWCTDDGAVLVDGLWLQHGPYGAVVNLDGEVAPDLSIDRKKIINYRAQDVDALLRQAAVAAASVDSPVFTHEWISAIARRNPELADLIFDLGVKAGWRQWPNQDHSGETLLITGCFPPDEDASWLPPARWAADPDNRLAPGSADSQDSVSAHYGLSKWRATAWAATGAFGPDVTPGVPSRAIVPARPSDASILSTKPHPSFRSGTPPRAGRRWLDPAEPVPAGHLFAAAVRLRRSPRAIADRLTELGYTVENDPDILPTHVPSEEDTSVLSFNPRKAGSWLRLGKTVPLSAVYAAAFRLRQSPSVIADRLTELGYTIATDIDPLITQPLSPDDAIMLSRDLGGEAPWLRLSDLVPTGHLHAAAIQMRQSPRAIADRLIELGYTIATDVDTLPKQPLPKDDAILFSLHVNGNAPWLDPAAPVPYANFFAAAAELARSPRAIADRLTELGYTIDVDINTLRAKRPSQTDASLLSLDGDGIAPWLNPAEPVPTGHLYAAAARQQRSPRFIADRLTELGHTIDIDIDVLPTQPSEDDAKVLRIDSDEEERWLRLSGQVPIHHLYLAAASLRRSPRAVAERLAELGFTIDFDFDIDTLVAQPISKDDVALFDLGEDDASPWLRRSEPVPTGHVNVVAARLSRSPRAIAERLIELGLTMDSDVDTLSSRPPVEDHVTILSQDLDGVAPWLPPFRPVPVVRLYIAAALLRQSPKAIAERLTDLGYTVDTDLDTLFAQPLSEDDAKVLRGDREAEGPWLDPSEPVPTGRIFAAAARLQRSPHAVAERLTELGYQTSGWLFGAKPGTSASTPTNRL
ncbi:hypothetical protein GCM10022251_14090 [Phytohabitans flavus]|uniref:Uncharacterized protein n=1 Tax=Phytohabitans flavus TaxID=1076124 RepID=A0A6F8XIX7_9ACTN|nr:caspase family protein [Phytohabitans flavus]BCB73765.1 hypothetical protein Pflav_001750 [Phytohabitans flavus]